MNTSNLIDLSGNGDKCFQISPLVKPDPFDLVLECSLKNMKEANKDENKENICNLSPFHTPNSKKALVSKEPLYIGCDNVEPASLKRKDLKRVLRLNCQNSPKLDSSTNSPNDSLQFLSDSLLNSSQFDLEKSFNAALALPLPNSPENSVQNTEISQSTSDDKIFNSLYATHDSCNTFNRAFMNSVEVSKINYSNLSTSAISKDSYKHFALFNGVNAGNVDISQIRSSVSSSQGSKEQDSHNLFNIGFRQSNLDFQERYSNFNIHRACLSARKPTKSERALNYLASVSDTPKSNFHNSFSGFNVRERLDFQQQDLDNAEIDKNNSVFLEATQMAHMFSKIAEYGDEDDSDSNSEDYDISKCPPPWLDCEDENIIDEIKDQENIKAENQCTVVTTSSEIKPDSNPKDDLNVIKESNNKIDRKTLGENLLDTLALAFTLDNPDSSDGKADDKLSRKKLGETLLNTLALALNIQTDTIEKPDDEIPCRVSPNSEVLDLRMHKSESIDVLDLSMSALSKSVRKESTQELKPFIPKVQLPSAQLPVKSIFENKLKPKTEKLKVPNRGPLKAVLPLQNMTKSFSAKSSSLSVTPCKSLQMPSLTYQNKRTSTPNEPRIKPPIAQSTPDMRKAQLSDSPLPVKSKLRYSLSPLAKRTSFNNSMDLNKSTPGKNKSGSTGSIPKVQKATPKDLNSSIPSIYGNTLSRRKSASDLKESTSIPSKFDGNRTLKARGELKRTSSFQSKLSSTIRSLIRKPNVPASK